MQKGSYTVRKSASDPNSAEKLSQKVDRLSHEIEDFVADELKGFFGELKEAAE